MDNEVFDNMIYSRTVEIYEHDIYFASDIIQPSRYNGLISLLNAASEHDTFNFFFNTDGGSLESAIAIMEAIDNSNAHSIAHIVGKCHSAGSVIALNCPNIKVYKNAAMMVHTSFFGSEGHAINVKAQSDFLSNLTDDLLRKSYDGFLSEEELKSVRGGIELWFNSEEIEKRLIQRARYREVEHS